ncbi:cadherin-related family member 4 isoform X11 [Peromyscus maniculatus bairdii]|uniref:cadherin-related family member 4 isoform X11 n=1 Tax=Peromyscus maniculatus bairdii TaxID=230844 RepID=UPI001C2E5006|nr:cadherin-related family member 4 isoform X7 [Peromyscus maniculatus bairdii]
MSDVGGMKDFGCLASSCGEALKKKRHCYVSVCGFLLVLHSLPWSIDLSESQGPGTTLQSFSFNCSSYMPTLELLSVRPPTGFFNKPSLHSLHGLHKGVYVGKVTLSSSARLDALAVNHYELQLQYKCGNFVVSGPLFVHVQRDPGRFRCAGPFASPAGEFIYVPETVTPGALLYTLLLPGLGVQRAQMNITSAQDPPLFPGPFSIDEQGLLRAPSQGLSGQALKKAQSITIPEDLVPGSKVIQVQARGSNLLYEIISPLPSPLYSIGQADGVVRTTAPLDLARAQGAAVTKLQVRAFERLRPWASAEFDLTVNVRAVNQWPPRCHPALLVTQVPETTPVGTVLSKLTCVDPDSAGAPLDFQLQFYNPPDSASLRLRDRVLEVNTTLDCDTPGACFQHAASILVLDDGQPQMTTEVPVLVMVTPVNEFSPACVPRTFRVREDAGPHTLLGSVVGTDADYPHNSLEYYISGGPSTFAVDRLSGEIHLLGPLDYEQQRWYKITILLIDHSQDWDLNRHRSGSCTVTIEVEDVNDHAPECEPPFQELTTYTPLGRSMEVTKVSCWIPREPQRSAFTYSIVGGNSQSRFRLQGTVLMHNDTVLGPPWPEQPCTYELLIHVADAGPSIPHLSTTTTIIVHLVPWRAGTVATSTHRSTVSSTMTPLIVTEVEAFWKPEPWFVVVLTATGAVLLLALGWLLSRILRGFAQLLQAPSKPARALLLNSVPGNEGSVERLMEAPRMEMSQQHFDGRAHDVRTGRDYLFSTRTGARRWL